MLEFFKENVIARELTPTQMFGLFSVVLNYDTKVSSDCYQRTIVPSAYIIKFDDYIRFLKLEISPSSTNNTFVLADATLLKCAEKVSLLLKGLYQLEYSKEDSKNIRLTHFFGGMNDEIQECLHQLYSSFLLNCAVIQAKLCELARTDAGQYIPFIIPDLGVFKHLENMQNVFPLYTDEDEIFAFDFEECGNLESPLNVGLLGRGALTEVVAKATGYIDINNYLYRGIYGVNMPFSKLTSETEKAKESIMESLIKLLFNCNDSLMDLGKYMEAPYTLEKALNSDLLGHLRSTTVEPNKLVDFRDSRVVSLLEGRFYIIEKLANSPISEYYTILQGLRASLTTFYPNDHYEIQVIMRLCRNYSLLKQNLSLRGITDTEDTFKYEVEINKSLISTLFTCLDKQHYVKALFDKHNNRFTMMDALNHKPFVDYLKVNTIQETCELTDIIKLPLLDARIRLIETLKDLPIYNEETRKSKDSKEVTLPDVLNSLKNSVKMLYPDSSRQLVSLTRDLEKVTSSIEDVYEAKSKSRFADRYPQTDYKVLLETIRAKSKVRELTTLEESIEESHVWLQHLLAIYEAVDTLYSDNKEVHLLGLKTSHVDGMVTTAVSKDEPVKFLSFVEH